MVKPVPRTPFITLVLILAGILLQASGALAEPVKRVAILPFAMHAEKDLSFLQEGILDMLNSRIAWKDKVEIIEKGTVKKKVKEAGAPLDQEKAAAIGKALGADYVILGSLTIFGDSVSLDAKILDLSKGETLITAFNESKGMDEVIPTVNQFAQDINAKIMGRKIETAETAKQAEKPREEEGPLIRADRGPGEGTAEPSHVQRMNIEITALDVGDVDGDGKNELVLTDKTTVFVYRWEKQGLVLLKSVEAGWSPWHVYVSVADLDRNGKAEIYVSSLSSTNVSSLVYEWSGADLKPLATGLPWLMRVTEVPGKGVVLLGQKRVTSGIYLGPVKILKREGGALREEAELPLSRFANIFNFVQTDLEGKGKLCTILLDNFEHLRIYDQQNEMIWKSPDFFGGTLTYMEDRGRGYMRDTGTGKRVYLPSPLFLADVEGDGKKELVVCQNHSKTARLVDDARWFTSGKLHFLAWDGVGLTTRWTSQTVTGPVVGYAMGNLDGEANTELVIASVTSEAHLLGKPKSQVTIYHLK